MDQQTLILAGFTPYHSKFLAHRLTLEGLGEDAWRARYPQPALR
jgi:hypothetical protein